MKLASFVFHSPPMTVSSAGRRVTSTLAFATALVLGGAAMTGSVWAQDAAKSAENVVVSPIGEPVRNGDGKQSAKPADSTAIVVETGRALDASVPAADLVARHPIGSVSTVAGADEVLADVARARAEVESRTVNAQRICYEKFFTNHCLNAAKEQRHLALKQIRLLEVEANAFKRRATADDRDKALADQRTKEEIESPKREQDQMEKDSANARKVKEASEKAAAVETSTKLHAGEAEKRLAENAAKLQRIRQAEAAKASERAANRAAFIKKGQDAAARQREVAAKKAEKERQLAEKKASTAPATPAPAP